MILVALLTFAGTGARYVAPTLGHLIKRVRTVDGNVDVYRNAAGCTLTFRGEVEQTVSLAVCQS